jgi:hypothetical protein
MAQEPVGNRRFTEKEISAILQRATELQAHEEGTSPGGGMSLEQLQQAATELGIKPHLISRAAADVASGSMERPYSFWSPTTHLHLEGVVPHRISEDNWPTLLNKMRRVSGRVGDSVSVGKSFEWTSDSPDTCHVSVTPHGEQSRVSIASRYGEWIMVFYFLPLLPAFIACIVATKATSFSGPVDTAVILGILAGAMGLGHLGFANLARARRRTAQALMTVLETPTEDTVAEAQTTIAEVPLVTAVPPVASYLTQSDNEAQPVVQVVHRK